MHSGNLATNPSLDLDFQDIDVSPPLEHSLVVLRRHTEAQDLIEQYLLQVQAADDPIAPAEGIPYEALAANDNCILAGAHPWQWYDDD